MAYEFAIKKDVLKSGREILTPVMRKKSRFLSSNWQRITKLYGKYILLELDFSPELTYEECKQHIEGYQDEITKSKENDVKTVELHGLEEKEL